MTKTLALIAKTTITLALLYFSVSRAGLGLIAEHAEQLNPGWFLASVAVLSLQTLISAVRWRGIIRDCGATISLAQAARWTFMSLFFMQALPSTIGGEAVRIWLAARDGAGWSKAIYSVAIDRLAGVAVLAAMVIICIPESFAVIHDPVARLDIVILGLLGISLPAVFVGLGRWHWAAAFKQARVLRHIEAAASLAYKIFSSPRPVLRITALSLAVHCLTILAAWLAAKSVAARFDLLHAALLIPPVLLVMIAPISIAGWGVRESAMVMAFSYSGLSQTDGFLASVLFGFTTFATGMVGGLIWMIGARGRQPILAGESSGIPEHAILRQPRGLPNDETILAP